MLQSFPPHLSDVATLPWEIQKSHFSTLFFIYFRLFTLPQKKTNSNCCLQLQLFTYCWLVLPIVRIALVLRLGHATREACTDTEMLRLAAAACCDMGWILAQRGVLCDWTVSKKTGSMYPCRRWYSEHLRWHCLPDIPVATHHNRFFSEPPTITHTWLSLEPPTFERTQQTFTQMKKFSNSQVSVVTFSGGVGKWITVCFLLR